MCAAHPVTTAHCRPAASVIFHSANDTGLGNDFEVLISQFRFSDGRPAVLLQNHGADVNLWASVEFCGQEVVNTLREVDSSTGEEGPVYDDSPLAYGRDPFCGWRRRRQIVRDLKRGLGGVWLECTGTCTGCHGDYMRSAGTGERPDSIADGDGQGPCSSR
jgi:hypothetical protein